MAMPSYLNEPGYRESPGTLSTNEHYYEPYKDFVKLTACLENQEWEDAIAICTRLIQMSKSADAHGWAGLGIGENRIARAPDEVQQAVRLANQHATLRDKKEREMDEKRMKNDKVGDKKRGW